MHRRRALWNIHGLLAWTFIKNGSRSQWLRVDGLGQWNIWARLPMILARSASFASVLGAPARRWRYEAGPCGYGAHRQLTKLGHRCDVVAPSLIPKKPGDRVKTDRRDATMLARLHRAGELTAVWVPDADHEAMRDLVRLRSVVRQIVTRARQHLQGFLLRHGRKHGRGTAWRMAYRRWLSTLTFEHPAQQIAFQDYVDAVTDGERRLQHQTRAVVTPQVRRTVRGTHHCRNGFQIVPRYGGTN